MEHVRKADIGNAPYAGSGKLTDYRKDGSWMMNQIERGYDKCDRGIKVDETDPMHKRFARIAASLTGEKYTVKREYSVSGSEIALRWSVSGSMDAVNINELALAGEFITVTSENDLQCIMCECSGADFSYIGNPMVEFKAKCISRQAVLKGVKADKKLKDLLKENGFAEAKAE